MFCTGEAPVPQNRMALLLTNALLVDIDPIRVDSGSLRIEGNKIAARGVATQAAGDQTIDCHGAVVLPGFVNGHTHLYSALATGMPAPPRQPRNFHEVLQLIWWRLDQALNAESNEMSATIGALDALHCGTTTLIDHHASPRAISGSLDAIERGIASIGLRGVLCYETTDRHGKPGRIAGLEENRRYLNPLRAPGFNRRGHAASFVGAHACFTLSDESLAALNELASEFNSASTFTSPKTPATRRPVFAITRCRLLPASNATISYSRRISSATPSISQMRAIARLNAANNVSLAHNPRSNMNNAVGYSPIGKLTNPIQLGTDGIGADMFTEAKAAWFKSRDGRAGISPDQVIQMLANSARRASQALNVTLGKLQVGAAADVVITDYVPSTPLTTDNLVGHFLHGMSVQNVRHVIAGGKLALKDRVVQTCDEPAIRAAARTAAAALWHRMETIPG